MKIYIIEQTIGVTSFVQEVFTTYRGASEWLLEEGFIPCVEEFSGDCQLGFYIDDPEWHDTIAMILERDLIER